ncbi:hydrogenase iron-sulfur subunit [Desulfitibacter alkalitolerans]|uniref:hydrogenase iron-sulfur subunit n=1 Tax=Desulfitibacter alkalitolerans TaxID=264641 RepID=UPI0004833CAE|nr:hydrogenase iron-sulfur subunit [Desulfitibacter alkalitolerans]
MSKVGVVLCRCNSLIDKKIDITYIKEKLTGDKNISSIIEVDMLCSPVGRDTFEKLAMDNSIDRFVVAACSPFAKGTVLTNYATNLGISLGLFEIVNIREQCAWVHDMEGATQKGLILIKMGLNRIIKAKPDPDTEPDSCILKCAKINELKCDKCKRCLEECPNNAISLKENGYPLINRQICQACGVCMGGCPLGVISLPSLKIEEISHMLKAIPGESLPAIAGFFCDFAYEEADLMGHMGAKYPTNLYIIRVPCSGAVNMITVNDAIGEGLDGVLIAGCEASQCERKKGNELARYRIENFQKNLEEQFLERERLTYISLGEGYKEASAINQEKCNKCGFCRQICPYGAVKIQGDSSYQIHAKACRLCGTCAASCKAGAIVVPDSSDKKIMDAIATILAS